MARRTLAALAGLTYGLSTLVASAADPVPVTLTIENATAGPALRCQLVLAHFVTQDLAPIPANAVAEVDMQRDSGGTLFFQGGGRSMAVENILCSLDDNWTASRNNLDLRSLREGALPALRVTCSATDSLTCRAP